MTLTSAPKDQARRDTCPLAPQPGGLWTRDTLSAMGRAYSEKGFIDCTVTNNTELDQVNQAVAIVVDISEGTQYRWGDIQVFGLDLKAETLLRSQLKSGSPVNPRLIDDFYQDNKSHLPVGASPERVKWRSDARAIVDLTFDFRTPALP